MSYLLNKIEVKDLAKFLLNPYERAVYVEDVVLQKYPINSSTDDVYMITDGDKDRLFRHYGRINYIKGEIMELKPFDFNQVHPFISVKWFRNAIIDKVNSDLEAMKVSRADEVKLTPKYIDIVKKHKEGLLEHTLAEMLGAVTYYHYITDKTRMAVSKFLSTVSIDGYYNFRYGDVSIVEEGAKDIFMSENFLINHFLLPDIKEEARKMIETGALTERQKHLQNIINKTKDCGCATFKAETTDGLELSCKSLILTDGTIFVNGRPDMKSIDFEKISKVISRGKVIYEKGVF